VGDAHPTLGRDRGAELATAPRTKYSDNWPVALQRRERMHRQSPIITGLLIAATLSVDAAAFAHLLAVGSTLSVSTSDAYLLVDALLMPQVGVVCAWSALANSKAIWIRTIPWLAVIAAVTLKVTAITLLTESTLSESLRYWGLRSDLSMYLFPTAVLMAALWISQRTRFWQNRTQMKREWQFSLGQMLVVTTVTAVLVACMAGNSMFVGDDGRWLTWAWLFSIAFLAFAAIVAWSFPWHWLLRFSSVLAVALALGLFFGYQYGGDLPFHLERQSAYYTIQAIVLSVWLGLGPILPVSSVSSASSQL
jgi:hypothetical protein